MTKTTKRAPILKLESRAAQIQIEEAVIAVEDGRMNDAAMHAAKACDITRREAVEAFKSGAKITHDEDSALAVMKFLADVQSARWDRRSL